MLFVLLSSFINYRVARNPNWFYLNCTLCHCDVCIIQEIISCTLWFVKTGHYMIGDNFVKYVNQFSQFFHRREENPI